MPLPFPLLKLSPEESRDRDGSISPTLSGAMRVVDGEYGPAWFVEEGTTNYVPNPRFVSGWGSPRLPDGGSVDIFVDEGTAPNNIPATLRWEVRGGPNAGTSGRFLLSASPGVAGLSGGTWTESVWVRTSSPDLVPMIYTDVRSGSNGITGTMVTETNHLPEGMVPGEWFRITLTKGDWNRGDPTDATFYLGVYPRKAGATGTVEFAGPQFEPKAYATSYCDGSLGTGYSWSGAENASASTRTMSKVSFSPVFLPSRGGIYFRYNPRDMTGKPNVPHVMYNSGSNYITRSAADARYNFNVAGSGFMAVDLPSDRRLQPHIIGMEWDTGIIRGIVDEVAEERERDVPAGFVMPSDWATGGGDPYSGDGQYSNVLTFPRPLTDAERAELFAMDDWNWEPMVPRFGGATITIPPEPILVSQTAPAPSPLPSLPAPDLLVTPDDVTPDGHHEYVDGAWRLWVGTENLLQNPSWEGTSGWLYSGSPAVVPGGVHGSSMLRLTVSAGNTQSIIYTQGNNTPQVIAGAAYTVSAWVRAKKGTSVRPYVTLWTQPSRTGSFIYDNGPDIAATGDWQFLSHTFVVPSGYVGASPSVMNRDASAGDVMDADAFQFERKSFATPFVVGTREQGAITVLADGALGLILIRYRENGVEQTAVLNGPGRFGESGIVKQDGGIVTITTDNEIDFLGMIAYSASAVISPEGSYGAFVNGIVDREDDAFRLVKGIREHATLLLSAGGSYDQQGAVSPTLIGGVLTVPGPHGPVWQVGEPTTNLFENPSQAINSSGWGSWSAGGELSTVSDIPLPPIAPATHRARRFSRTSTGSVTITFHSGHSYGFPVVEGRTYTASVYGRHADDTDRNLTLSIGCYAADGAYLGASVATSMVSTLSAPGAWTRIVSTFTAPAGVAYVRPVVGLNGGALDLWACLGQFEEKPYATPYVDGSLGDGYTWAGAEHASSSSRAGTDIRHINPNGDRYVTPVRGGAMFRLRRDSPQMHNGYLLHLSSYGGTYDAVIVTTASGGRVNLNSKLNDRGSPDTTASRELRDGVWEAASTWWDGDQMGTRLATGETTQRTRDVPDGPFSEFLSLTSGGNQTINGARGETIILNHPLSEAERTRILAMNRPWTWDPDGTITIQIEPGPHTIVIGYREGGIDKLQTLTGPGTFGESGVVSYRSGKIVVTTTDEAEVRFVLVDPPVIAQEALDALVSLGRAWHASDFIAQLGGVLVTPGG